MAIPLKTYRVGANFCLERGETEEIILLCPIIQECPLAFPRAIRGWDKDGIFVYVGLDGIDYMLRDEFLDANPLFIPGVVFPSPFDIRTGSTGSLRLSTAASNISMPTFVPPGANVRDEVFDRLLGIYTCIVENEYGDDTATTIISECGRKLPLFHAKNWLTIITLLHVSPLMSQLNQLSHLSPQKNQLSHLSPQKNQHAQVYRLRI